MLFQFLWPQKWNGSICGAPIGHLHIWSVSDSKEMFRLIGTTMSSIGIGAGSRRGAGWAWVFITVLPLTKVRVPRCIEGTRIRRTRGTLEAGRARPERLRRWTL